MWARAGSDGKLRLKLRCILRQLSRKPSEISKMTIENSTAEDHQFQYVEGQGRPTFPALLDAYKAASDAVVLSEDGTIDIPYGSAERQTFDFFVAKGTPAATMVYFHAGYWQSRDKFWFRFIAPAYTRRGINVAFVNYPLCPTVTLTSLVDGVRASIPRVLDHARALGQPGVPLIAAGHSAGAHLAVEMALSFGATLDGQPPAIDGVIALSGIYDLVPLLSTSLNTKLKLDGAEAEANSPLHRVRAGLPPALFVVGAEETPAFIAQNRVMADGWRRAGNDSFVDEAVAADHFSLLQAFSADDGATRSAVDRLFEQAQRRFDAAGK